MQCLLDKVTIRFIVNGIFKLSVGQPLTSDEITAILLWRANPTTKFDFLISPQSANLLAKFSGTDRYSVPIHEFLNQVQIAQPTNYYKRWSRRIRDLGFSREDAAILALATFGVNSADLCLGMEVIATFDQPMIKHWVDQQDKIVAKFSAMQHNLPSFYKNTSLPRVIRPDQILSE